MLVAEIKRCHARLEIDHVWRSNGGTEPVRTEVPYEERESIPDGIECRNETIRLQEEGIASLTAERDRLRAALRAIPKDNRRATSFIEGIFVDAGNPTDHELREFNIVMAILTAAIRARAALAHGEGKE